MDLALYSLCGLISLFSFLFIFWPILTKQNKKVFNAPIFRELQSLQFERLRLLENIQDLESDFNFGKMTEADFLDLQSSILSELAPIMARLKELDVELEKVIK